MVEERQTHGDAYHGRYILDLFVRGLWMRTAWMGKVYWKRKITCPLRWNTCKQHGLKRGWATLYTKGVRNGWNGMGFAAQLCTPAYIASNSIFSSSTHLLLGDTPNSYCYFPLSWYHRLVKLDAPRTPNALMYMYA